MINAKVEAIGLPLFVAKMMHCLWEDDVSVCYHLGIR